MGRALVNKNDLKAAAEGLSGVNFKGESGVIDTTSASPSYTTSVTQEQSTEIKLGS